MISTTQSSQKHVGYMNRRVSDFEELNKRREIETQQPKRRHLIHQKIQKTSEIQTDDAAFSCMQRLNIWFAKCCCFCGYIPSWCPCKGCRNHENIFEYERAVVFRYGLLHPSGVLGPGYVDLLTNIDKVEQKVDLREAYCLYHNDDLKTLDGTRLAIKSVIYYQVTDPLKSVLNVEDGDVSKQIINIMKGLIRYAIEKREFWTVLNEKKLIQSDLMEQLKKHTISWGTTVNRIELYEVLPFNIALINR